MNNLAFKSYCMTWDGLSDYEAHKDLYDYMGLINGYSNGIEYHFVEELSKGNRFSNFAEASAKKILQINDSPSSNSLHDGEFDHPMMGKIIVEIRCVTGSISTAHSSEIGGGGRSTTKETNNSGLKTNEYSHLRNFHKLNTTTHFIFFFLKYTPMLHISIVESKVLIDLWDQERYGLWQYPDGDATEKKFLLRDTMSVNPFLEMIYGTSNINQIKWEEKNPWNISPERAEENIKIYNNISGIKKTKTLLNIKKQRRIDVDEEIERNLGMYNVPSKAIKTINGSETTVDIFNIDNNKS